MTATSSQAFIPVATVHAGGGGPQLYLPALTEAGEPVWQPGDLDPLPFQISSLGWSRGTIHNGDRQEGLQGLLYVTGARVVVVSRLRDGGDLVSAATRNLVDHLTGRDAPKKSYLVGQLRLPWVKLLAYGLPSVNQTSQGEIRISATYRTAFGDKEAVFLLMRLRNRDEVNEFVSELVRRIYQDRYHFEGTTDEQRRQLEAIPAPDEIVVDHGKIPVIHFYGSWLVSKTSGRNGTVSKLSFALDGVGSGGCKNAHSNGGVEV